MDFSLIFQLKTKKFWWMDVILYFVVALLLAAVFCYIVFSFKNNSQRKDIQVEIDALKSVGTAEQKEEETEVINYQKKINDFSSLLKNHSFTSNVLAFMEKQTIPNVWYKQFSLDAKNREVQISGETDDMGALSGQVAVFESTENQKYVKSIGTLNSSIGDSSRVNFNTNLLLNQSILDYASNLSSISQTTTPSDQTVAVNNAPVAGTTGTTATNSPAPTVVPQTSATKSSEKLITSFHLDLKPEVVGTIDQTKHTITSNVPFGTDVKNLISLMVISPGATVTPASRVSQDFTSPVNYRVTAEDGSIQSYQVSVIVVAAPPQTNEKNSQSGFTVLTIMMLAGVVIVVIIIIILLVWKKILGRKINKQ